MLSIRKIVAYSGRPGQLVVRVANNERLHRYRGSMHPDDSRRRRPPLLRTQTTSCLGHGGVSNPPLAELAVPLGSGGEKVGVGV